ncbi:MAG: succinylglutamate desuccinylase/aspartoacylase family protein [Candidatus Thorarchaeota archaeon]
MKEILIGSVKSETGKITYGFIDGIDLPTGTVERIPVIIAQGTEEGPTMFLTANIHGNELTGIAVIHDVVTEELVSELKGTIVAIPTLNPSGLRAGDRSSEFSKDDTNRTFPEGIFVKTDEDDEDRKYPKPFEQIANRVYSYFEKYADFHIDFHNHSIQSIPYSILDRIFYTDDISKEDAEQLAQKQKEMVEAFSVIYTADFPSKKYLKLKYHRSVSGSVLNSLRIPAFTVELGANTILLPEVVAGSVKGTRNVLRWAGMIDSAMEEITEFDVTQPKERLQRIEHPRSEHSGVIKFLVKPGEKVTKGQSIAKLTDIFGKPLGDGFIRTEYDGYMIALYPTMTVYSNGAISEMGIKDVDPMVVKYQEKKS